ncbi:hypothetical protein CDAR_451691 [Caerostris darwini]|uniref:Uncharacterized protein n=1 Tax=Caerostris darwini TaxID=1538125 RepID=A0AAV4VZI7_9ARAC|nr:hypothetical protein CDAR_451691 [Caerostris darwini]
MCSKQYPSKLLLGDLFPRAPSEQDMGGTAFPSISMARTTKMVQFFWNIQGLFFYGPWKNHFSKRCITLLEKLQTVRLHPGTIMGVKLIRMKLSD